jgi:hypothetical protein
MDSFPRDMIERVRNMLESIFDAAHGKGLPAEKTEMILRNELIELLAGNRKYWYIVLAKSEGTIYSNLKNEAVERKRKTSGERP